MISHLLNLFSPWLIPKESAYILSTLTYCKYSPRFLPGSMILDLNFFISHLQNNKLRVLLTYTISLNSSNDGRGGGELSVPEGLDSQVLSCEIPFS